MVQFNELRITPDGKCLIINVSIKDVTYYKDIFIDSIVIDTQDTYIPSGPSNNPVYTYTIKGDNKSVSLVLNYQDIGLSLSSNMFFIYVISKGVPSIDTPCGMDESIAMNTVIDLYPTYCKTIQFLKEIDNECNLPVNLINMILRIKALELSIKTGNYPQAIMYWKRYFYSPQNKSNFKQLNNCGCNN